MKLPFFVVISEHTIQVPQIKIQHRTLLWRIYFPHYQASKLNRKNKVKQLFLTCCQTNPIYFHCPIYRTTAIGKSLLPYLGRAHCWKGTESEVAPGIQHPHHWAYPWGLLCSPHAQPYITNTHHSTYAQNWITEGGKHDGNWKNPPWVIWEAFRIFDIFIKKSLQL